MNRHADFNLEQVVEAALRPLAPSGRRFWALAAVLGVVVGSALVAYVVQFTSGLGAAGYNDQVFWGIYEANLVAFIGVSYGGALVSAILRLTQAKWRAPITRLAEAMAVFSLLVGMVFALIHLGRPERFWLLIANPQISSPLVWDFVAIMTYLLATLIFLYLPLIPDLATLRDRLAARGGWMFRLYSLLALEWHDLPAQRRLLNRATMLVAILIIPIAVVVHSVLSWAFAVTSRPGWHSTIFAPYFVVAALFSGVAMVILVVAGFRKGYRLEQYIQLKHFQYLGYLLVTLDLMYLYFTFTEMLTEGYAGVEDVMPILDALLIGQYAPLFWFFVLGAGVLPIVLVALPRTRTINGIVIGSALVVSGMWLKRILIVVPAVAHPLIAGAWGSFQVTWVSAALTIGGAAAIPLLLMLFFKFFPILAIDEMAEVAAEAAAEHAAAPQPSLALGEGGVVR